MYFQAIQAFVSKNAGGQEISSPYDQYISWISIQQKGEAYLRTATYEGSQLRTSQSKMQSQAPGSQASGVHQPRIVYFISRSNGTMVPLIAADELPFNVRLHSVPRALGPDQIFGLQMVGSAPYTGLTFKLEHDHPVSHSNNQATAYHTRHYSGSEPRQFLPPDALARQALTSTPPSPTSYTKLQHSLPPRPGSAHEVSTSWRSGSKPPTSDPTQSVIDAIIATQSGASEAARLGYTSKSATPQPTPSGNVPDPEKKEFCTYWIRTGECDYAQQGCLYKHEMPDSLDKLQKLGFRQWPYWWRERNVKVRIGEGGEGAVSRPVVKPEVWLKQSKGSDSDDESDDESGKSEESDVVVVKKSDADEMPPIVAKEVEEDVKATRKKSTVAAVPDIKGRKASTTGDDDLISFVADVTPSLKGASFALPSLPTGLLTPASTPSKGSRALSPSEAIAPTQKTIFVPAGESTAAHIADARKREKAARRARTTAEFKVLSTGPVFPNLDTNTGLMASKHAPTGKAPERSARAAALRELRPRVPRAKANGPAEKKMSGDGGIAAVASKHNTAEVAEKTAASSGGFTAVVAKSRL